MTSEVAARGRAQDDLRAAAQKDAAEIVARARRDLRRVVADARRELLELSAQVQAANVELADPLLDRALLETLAVEPDSGDPWMALASEADTSQTDAVVPAVEHGAPVAPLFAIPLPPPRGGAGAFVALGATAVILALAGTVWWLERAPAPASTGGLRSAPARVDEPVAPAEPAEAVALPARPNTLSIGLEVQRDTWIRTTIDGSSDGGRMYTVGETQRIDGATDVSIRAGDAGGLLVSVDGAPAAPFGPDGTSLTRRFIRAQPSLTAPPTVDTSLPTAAAAPAPAPLASPTSTAASTPPPPGPVATAPTSAPSATTAAPVGSVPPSAPVAVPPAQAAGRGSAPARVDIAASGRQWLDAYHRQDLAALDPLTSPSLVVRDERRPDQRFPFGLEVTRAFDDEQLQLSGDSATFIARVTERAATGALISRLSQTWVRRLGEWRLQEARLVAEGQLPPAGR